MRVKVAYPSNINVEDAGKTGTFICRFPRGMVLVKLDEPDESGDVASYPFGQEELIELPSGRWLPSLSA